MSRTWTDSAIRWLINKCKTTFLPKNQFYDGYLGWGGRNIAGDVSPIDAAMSSLHNPNRAEMCKAEGITVEHSSDGGITWNDYGLSDDYKRRLLSVNGWTVPYVPGGAKNRSTDVRLRVTLNATKMGVYTAIKKVLVNFSTQGASGCEVLVERSYKGSENVWKTLFKQAVTGWSGWNSLSISGAFGGGDTQIYNIANIRMTFSVNTMPAGDSYNGNPYLQNILLLGTMCWVSPSNMARLGHLYLWDMAGNATFPARVNAESFNGYTIKANVPADAKFTDTTYTPVTSVANGLMTASDKKKLDGFSNADQYAKTADVAGKPRAFQNVSVPVSLWESGSEDGEYLANVPLSGVTQDMYPQIVFNPSEDGLYNFSPTCMTYDGGVQIYAETMPTDAITLLSVVCFSV